MAWIKDNLSDFYEGEPEVTMGEVVVSIAAPAGMAA